MPRREEVESLREESSLGSTPDPLLSVANGDRIKFTDVTGTGFTVLNDKYFFVSDTGTNDFKIRGSLDQKPCFDANGNIPTGATDTKKSYNDAEAKIDTLYELKFTRFDVEGTGNCNGDHVEIKAPGPGTGSEGCFKFSKK